MSENRRMLSRVVANYAGLFASLTIGILFTRELIRVLGGDGFGLVALFGTTAGVGVMIQDIVKQTMIRELGYAHHHDDADFQATQADAFGVCALAAVLTVAVFAGVLAAVPLFEIPESLITAARWFIVAKAVQCLVFVLAAPLFNLYIVTERMGWANAMIVFERIALLTSIIAIGMLEGTSLQEKIIYYGFLSAALASGVTVLGAVGIAIADRQLRPSLGKMTRAGVKDLFKNSAVQGTAVTAVNLHPRVDGFIVNGYVGLAGNFAYGLGFQFASYIRRFAVGMTQGLDAVAARFSAGGGDKDVRWLLRRSTQLHAAVIFPIGAFAIAFTPELIDLWVGDLIDDKPGARDLILPCVIVLSVGMSARALSDAWIRILYGAGKVKRYIWPVVIAAVLNPVIAIALSETLPEKFVVIGPPLAMGAVFLLIHCGWIGVITMRELGAGPGSVYRPLVGPAIGTAVATALTLGLLRLTPDIGRLDLLLAAVLFAVAYGGFCFFALLSSPQRAMLLKRVRRAA